MAKKTAVKTATTKKETVKKAAPKTNKTATTTKKETVVKPLKALKEEKKVFVFDEAIKNLRNLILTNNQEEFDKLKETYAENGLDYTVLVDSNQNIVLHYAFTNSEGYRERKAEIIIYGKKLGQL